MAGNEWLNGYLEAILDAGDGRNAGTKDDGQQQKIKKNLVTAGSLRKRLDEHMKLGKFQVTEKEVKLFSPTRYFVEEVVNSFDESDLYRTWIKVYLSLSFSLSPPIEYA